MLGQSGFGKVLKSFNKSKSDQLVAIKVLDKGRLRRNIGAIMDEIPSLYKLNHPNIVKYKETFDDQNKVYMVMEFINGQPLIELLTAQENQTFSEV